MEATKENILEACLQLFKEKGCRFTIDDIIKKLHISRKTFYRFFSSKDDVLKSIIDEYHEDVERQQFAIYHDPSLGLEEKLHRSLTLKAGREDEIDMTRVYELKRYSPRAYDYLLSVYEKGWDIVETLLKEGEAKGIYKKVNVVFVRTLLEKGMEMLQEGDFLSRNKISYQEGLHELADIVISGIKEEKYQK